MSSRRLVLNGLTAECAVAPVSRDFAVSPDSLDFYHELELYRQLLALDPVPTPVSAQAQAGGRRARTPDPTPPPPLLHDESPRRSRTPGAIVPRAVVRAHYPVFTHARHARYLGSFPVDGGEGKHARDSEHARSDETLSQQLLLMKDSGCAVPVLVVVALTGVKVCDPQDQSVRMSHALRRISYATCESPRALFALVARQPQHQLHSQRQECSQPAQHYCHAFETDTPEQAEELNSLVGNAFRMAFASQLQPSAPLWSKELNNECNGMGVRAPDTLPGLTHHYPHSGDRSPSKCDVMGVSKFVNEPSPSSSEESNSLTEVNCYRRLGERAPLMKRLALGLSGALLQPSDDDSTPLVTDTPTTPINIPLCMNGGYINEASEAEARTRESNRDQLQMSTQPAIPPAPRRCDILMQTELDLDFRRCNNIKNGACSRTTSSSSGASSCGGGGSGGGGGGGGGGSLSSGNNNIPRPEPELKQAPWFQQGIPREIALEVLNSQPVGAFLVRGSTTQTGCYALSVRVPRDFQPAGIAHYLILRTPKGYKIKGFTKEFTSLSALVTHHSVMPELLPAPLRLPRATLTHARAGVPPLPHRRREHADIDTLTHNHTHNHTPARHPQHPHFLPQLDV